MKEFKLYEQGKDMNDHMADLNGNKVEVKQILHYAGISKGAHEIKVSYDDWALTLQLSHGMNIGQAWYKGKQVFWDAPNPFRAYGEWIDGELMREKKHKKDGKLIKGLGGWLDTFNAGFILCGLDQCGSPGKDPVTQEYLTLHSRIGLLPAQNVTVTCYQYNGNPKVAIEGGVIQRLNGKDAYKLSRGVILTEGSNEIEIEDQVQNISDKVLPLVALYHVQFGGEALQAGSVFSTPAVKIVPRDEDAAKRMWEQKTMPGIADKEYEPEKLWFHIFPELEVIGSLLRTPSADFGVYLLHSQIELPQYSQWQMNGGWQFEKDNPAYNNVWYTNAPEPGWTRCHGRPTEREEGRRQLLGPGVTKTAHLVVGASTDRNQIMTLESMINTRATIRNPYPR